MNTTIQDNTVRGFILECLKRRAMSEAELSIGAGNQGQQVHSALNALEKEGLIENRAGSDWGLVTKD